MKNTKKKLNNQLRVVKSSFQQVVIASSLSRTQACQKQEGKLGFACVPICRDKIKEFTFVNDCFKDEHNKI